MSHIIAGRFGQQDQVQQAVEKLVECGFDENQISTFYVNPAGQHDMFYLGGDRLNSPGAKDTGTGIAVGVATGGLVGASVGFVGGPVGSVLGSLVGAHVGALVGSLSELKERGEEEDGGENTRSYRKAGMVVAVGVRKPKSRSNAIAILRSLGADQLEAAEGKIVNGDWQDFNPLVAPLLLKVDGMPDSRNSEA